MVAWLKIILPLLALALLSTVFLVSRSIDPTTTIPFTTIDLRERAREEQVTAPEFAGATEDGDLITFHAASAKPDSARPSQALATEIDARIDLKSGTVITFHAGGGSIDQAEDRAEFKGDVLIESSTGYRLNSQHLITGMTVISAESPGPVDGESPAGHISAGRMLLTDEAPQGAGQSDVHLLFTGGVKLLYDPSEKKD